MYRAFLLIILLLPVGIFAQDFDTSLTVPALSRPSSIVEGSTLVFDRRIKVAINGAGVVNGEMFIYINTVSGDVAVRTGPLRSLGPGELDFNQENFRLHRMTMGGKSFAYQTFGSGSNRKYVVTTGNTDVAPMTWPSSTGAVIERQDSDPTFLNEILSAAPYAGGSLTVYLHGGSLPRRLTWQKFLGHSGIGYLKTDRGIHLSLRSDMNGQTFIATELLAVNTAMDLTRFVQGDAVALQQNRDEYSAKLEKLREERFTGECYGEARALNRLKIADLEGRQRAAAESTRGNVYQDANVQRAYDTMMLPNLRIEIAEVEVELCKIRSARPTSNEVTSSRRTQRMGCLRDRKNDLERIQRIWDEIDASDLSTAEKHTDKIRLYGRRLIGGCGG